MLHQTFHADQHLGSYPPYAIGNALLIELLADAREAMHHDVQTAHRCLDRLMALLEGPPALQNEEIMLAPSPAAREPSAAPVKGGLAPWQRRRVFDHIDANLAGSISVDALASIARLSSGHFCRAFKATVGETPHTFLVRQRVRRAQTLMLSSADTLSQIACACGLTDQAHLTRLFRKFVGDTPLNWRRTWQHA